MILSILLKEKTLRRTSRWTLCITKHALSLTIALTGKESAEVLQQV